MSHRILLFGSRTWTDYEAIRQRLVKFPADTVVIHGGAGGADSLGGRVAKSLGFEVLVEAVTQAEYDSHGHKAPILRNQRMLDKHTPTCGLGFMRGWTNGSADMFHRLVRAGLPVDLYSRPKGKP